MLASGKSLNLILLPSNVERCNITDLNYVNRRLSTVHKAITNT